MEDKYYKYNLLYHKLSCTNEQTPMLLANFLLAAKAVRLYLVLLLLLLLFPKQVQSAEGLDCLKSTLDVCSIACTLPPCCLRFLSKSIFFGICSTTLRWQSLYPRTVSFQNSTHTVTCLASGFAVFPLHHILTLLLVFVIFLLT